MPTPEQRITELESQVRRLVREQEQTERIPWWEKIYGTFQDSEEYDEAMRLGREYRESLRPEDHAERDIV